MPKQIKATAFYTLGTGVIVYLIPGEQLDQAQRAFNTLAGLQPVTHDDYAAPGPRTMNLIAWDRHPSQDDAVGHIIEQHTWDVL